MRNSLIGLLALMMVLASSAVCWADESAQNQPQELYTFSEFLPVPDTQFPIMLATDLEGGLKYYFNPQTQLLAVKVQGQLLKADLGPALNQLRFVGGEHGYGSVVWSSLARAVKKFNAKSNNLSCVLAIGAGETEEDGTYTLFISGKDMLKVTGLVGEDGWPDEQFVGHFVF